LFQVKEKSGYFAPMSEKDLNNQKSKNYLKLFIKLLITAICVWYVSGKIDFSKAGAALRSAYLPYLLLAIITFIISKIFASIRLNYYFRNINVKLSEVENLKLYWLGMFYNLFLPGSVGGDAYKVILLKKSMDAPYKKTTAAVLLDRISGLLALWLILSVYSFFVLEYTGYKSSIVGGAVLAIFGLYYILNRWLKDFLPSFTATLLLGLLVQSAQVVAAYFIMSALGITVHTTPLIFIFLLSSIASVLPFTIGGLGIREIVFLQGSAYFGLPQETSVVISILFYLITLFTSAWGIIYVYHHPLKKAEAQS